MAALYTQTRIIPKIGPRALKTNCRERFVSAKGVWLVGVLVIVVLGGMEGGVFIPGEVGGIGALGAFLNVHHISWGASVHDGYGYICRSNCSISTNLIILI